MWTERPETPVEIISIGDELLGGYTVNSNAAFIGRELLAVGLPVRYVTTVGDSPEDMESTFAQALKRARIVITTGGLGPTDDDLTKRAIVKLFKRNLVFHEDIWEELRARYAARGIDIPPVNQNQALLPQGATIFPNKHGSAVGICLHENGRWFIALPGVPFEMQQILTEEVIPYLREKVRGAALHVRTLRTTGIVESALAELIKPQIKIEPGVKLAYLPGYAGVSLRITATGENETAASEKTERLARQIEKAAGKYLYGYGSDTLEEVVGQLLKDNDKTVAVAESCTGGRLGMTITTVPGASAWFVGGVIAYANDVKIEVLEVDPSLFAADGPGAVSEECAKQMASGCRRRLESDYALAITGIAGPEGGSEEKPVGTVFIGLASRHDASARKFSLGTERETIRARAVYAALEMLRREILDIT